MPKSRLKKLMQLPPHDGVAALAVIAPMAPTPPTRVNVAAAAKTLLLMDMEQFLSRNPSRTLRTAVWPAAGPADRVNRPPGLTG